MLTDHHCHLHDSIIYPHFEHIIAHAKAQGIFRFICCGMNENDWQKVLDLSRQNSQIIPAVGIHPWEVEKISDDWQNKMENVLQKHPEVIIGEIGLDLHFRKDTIEKQIQVLVEQLNIAKKHNRQVCIHNLKTWHLLVPILKNYPDLKILLHSFWASEEIIEQLNDLNVYYSLSGSILEKSEKKVRNLLNKLPIDRILLETDSPYLLPKYEKITNQEYNEPANLIFILEKLAEILKLDIEKLSEQLEKNSEDFLTR